MVSKYLSAWHIIRSIPVLDDSDQTIHTYPSLLLTERVANGGLKISGGGDVSASSVPGDSNHGWRWWVKSIHDEHISSRAIPSIPLMIRS